MSAEICARGAGVRFQLDRARRVITPAAARLLPRVQTTWGLRGLDLAIGPGESVALLGPSGSGKTTVLRILAGVLPVDEGTLSVRGAVGPLLSIQAGVLGRLTGTENALLLAVLQGLTRREAARALPAIRDASGLEDAFDRPVSTYSQGMRARLGFAAIQVSRPSILLLDEVHEALDHDYREIVAARAREIADAGGIVVAAGHDHGLLRQLCRRAVRMEDGHVVEDGLLALDDYQAEAHIEARAGRLTPPASPAAP